MAKDADPESMTANRIPHVKTMTHDSVSKQQLSKTDEIDALDIENLSICDDTPVVMTSIESGVYSMTHSITQPRWHTGVLNTELAIPSCIYIDEGITSMDEHNIPIQETDNETKTALINSNPVLFAVSVQDLDGDTGLHLGIIQKAISLVMNFIHFTPNNTWLNLPNKLLQTPLHLAVITNQLGIVRRLIVGGAKIDSVDCNGNTPLHIACRDGRTDIVNSLLKPVTCQEALMNKYAIPYQGIPQDLNSRNYNGHTCLHLAAMSTYMKVMDALLSKNADINVGDATSGRSVLHYVAESGNRILLRYLLSKRQLDVNCTTYGGLTPLQLAVGRAYGDVANILIRNGARVDHVENYDDDDDKNSDDDDDICLNGRPMCIQ